MGGDASKGEAQGLLPRIQTQDGDMLLVPAGPFTMGADTGGEEDERPAHTVELSAFYMDATEVTQKAYFACVQEKACAMPAMQHIDKFGGLFRGPARPVVGVSWFDAAQYCKHLGKRLPREAEFEKAVRGTDARRYPWGNEAPSKDRSVYQSNHTEDVASRPSGRGPFGHDDLAGNVWEWMDDDYDPIAYRRPGASAGTPGNCAEINKTQAELRRDGKQGFTGSNPIPTECEKAIRGGAYNYGAEGLRSSNRVHHPGTFRLLMTGFRCAKDAKPSP
jgi:formylglycine-generating enzyme required for sulfatase activity